MVSHGKVYNLKFERNYIYDLLLKELKKLGDLLAEEDFFKAEMSCYNLHYDFCPAVKYLDLYLLNGLRFCTLQELKKYQYSKQMEGLNLVTLERTAIVREVISHISPQDHIENNQILLYSELREALKLTSLDIIGLLETVFKKWNLKKNLSLDDVEAIITGDDCWEYALNEVSNDFKNYEILLTEAERILDWRAVMLEDLPFLQEDPEDPFVIQMHKDVMRMEKDYTRGRTVTKEKLCRGWRQANQTLAQEGFTPKFIQEISTLTETVRYFTWYIYKNSDPIINMRRVIQEKITVINCEGKKFMCLTDLLNIYLMDRQEFQKGVLFIRGPVVEKPNPLIMKTDAIALERDINSLCEELKKVLSDSKTIRRYKNELVYEQSGWAKGAFSDVRLYFNETLKIVPITHKDTVIGLFEDEGSVMYSTVKKGKEVQLPAAYHIEYKDKE